MLWSSVSTGLKIYSVLYSSLLSNLSILTYSCLNISRESTTQRKVVCWCVFSFTIPGDNFFCEMIKSSHHQDSRQQETDIVSSVEDGGKRFMKSLESSSHSPDPSTFCFILSSLSLWGWGWNFRVVILCMEVCIKSNSFASQTRLCACDQLQVTSCVCPHLICHITVSLSAGPVAARTSETSTSVTSNDGGSVWGRDNSLEGGW